MYRNLISKAAKKSGLSFSCTLIIALVANPIEVHAQQVDSLDVAGELVTDTIDIQRKRRGIDAELMDEGDYYLHPDGRQIRLLRKKDVYVIESNDSDRSMRGMRTQFGERVSDVANHRLGGRSVVRIDNGDAVKRRRNEPFDVSAAMLESTDNSIQSLKPIFANERGDGDILLLPKLTVKLDSGVEPQDALNRLDRRYGLTLDRKLRVSGNVYSLSLKRQQSESQQFALVRRVMNDVMVEWAEPQFVVKPHKTKYIPNNNPYFKDQWHLRNVGYSRSRCDTDCDATDAWDIGNANGNGAVAGNGIVIAIIDDGVQLDHEDLKIWINTDETNISDDVDNDGNGYVDDWHGWDFVDEFNNGLQNTNNTGACTDGDDGVIGPDNDPSPQLTTNCITANGDNVEQDNHGTAVAGLAAAIGTNNIGVVGTAFRAEILPIRLISEFDNGNNFCGRAAEAIEYAGRYADVVNNSWGLDIDCPVLDTAIANVVDGNLPISKRPGGSPVLFASGNSAGGWVKVSIPVSAGEHIYEWRFLRDNLLNNNNDDDGNSAWLDDITWPDGTTETFQSGTLSSLGFDAGNVEATNSCIAGCSGFLSGNAAWSIQTSPEVLFSGNSAAKVDASNTDCGNTYLNIIRDEVTAGDLIFWVWVDTETGADKFELLIDGEEVLSFGDDLNSFLTNSVGYPANLSATIAVGASNSGDLSGTTNVDPSTETRAFYSQYGTNLDILAPSSGQHLGITTTDREGTDGYNDGSESIVNDNYTRTFGGTSAATPIVAGVAAAMLAVNPTLTADQVKLRLRASASKIGNESYINDGSGSTRNNFYGYGRINMYRALLAANGDPIVDPTISPNCSDVTSSINFVSAHNIFTPKSFAFCPAVGELFEEDEDICFPIRSSNAKFSVICI